MTIIEDTRQQAEKHKLKHEYFESHNIKVIRSKLPFGDYALLTDLSTIIDTKQDLTEVCGNVCQQHKRFIAECDKAEDAGIKLIILVEEDNITSINDIFKWKNPRRFYSSQCVKGHQLAKMLHSIEVRHGVKFEFCKKSETGKKIVEIFGGEV